MSEHHHHHSGEHCSAGHSNAEENNPQQHQHGPGCHDGGPDYLLWGSLLGVVVLYLHYTVLPSSTGWASWYQTLASSVVELINTMWWGLLLGMMMVAVLSKVPREFVMSVLGTRRGPMGILRATAAGVMLDLCSHGILMVGAKLYERGATIGQVIAFLVASPWNSFSLTLVLIALIGLPWTIAFILMSMLIAIVVGLLFDGLVNRGVLPDNPARGELTGDFRFWAEVKKGLSRTRFNTAFWRSMLRAGIMESRMVLRWIFFGVLLASLVRAFVSAYMFETYFGPTLAGLGLTMLVATILEVCSEGSTPIAADLVGRAGAPGNGFAFLMTGVSTDYTEVMILKDTTLSWKIALFLPLLTVPQVLVVAWVMNLAA